MNAARERSEQAATAASAVSYNSSLGRRLQMQTSVGGREEAARKRGEHDDRHHFACRKEFSVATQDQTCGVHRRVQPDDRNEDCSSDRKPPPTASEVSQNRPVEQRNQESAGHGHGDA